MDKIIDVARLKNLIKKGEYIVLIGMDHTLPRHQYLS